MNREQRRRPSGVCGVTIDAGRRDVQCYVIRIGRVVVILLVTPNASVWCVVVISIRVAVVAVGCRVSSR